MRTVTWDEAFDIVKEKADGPVTGSATIPVSVLREVITYIQCLEIDSQCLSEDLEALRKQKAPRKITPSPYQPVGLRGLMK